MEIEWKHPGKDGRACARCAHTSDTVRRVAGELGEDLRFRGWMVTLKETLLSDNGILPRAGKPETCCSYRGDLRGPSALCRAIKYQGMSCAAIPPDL